MKKFLIVLLGMVSIACAVGAFVGCGAPAYYKLTYDEIEGVTFDFNGIESGADVKDGYTVVFTVDYSDNIYGKEDAQVKLNGVTLAQNSDGTYSFEMKQDSTVTVEGVSMPKTYKVSFLKIYTDSDGNLVENRVNFYDLQGNALEEVNLEAGEEIKFTIKISVYYDVDRENAYTVLANDMVLVGEEVDGQTVYSVAPIRETNIIVTDLVTKESFAGRNNGESDGEGTYENPYRIREAVDLYLLSDIVNDPFYSGNYNGIYYSLENDIDMQGEQLYIIGDGTTETAFFSGTFLGNGHKISNFVIKDTLIEQSGYTNVFLKYLGLFGRTMPHLELSKTGEIVIRPCVISDLTLENYTMEIDAASYRSEFYAGGLIGYAMGTEITNCNASGNIVVYASDTAGGYAGGLVGYGMAYYISDEYLCASKIVACTSSVAIDGRIGMLVCAGGIIGEIDGSDAAATAYVLNCSATGNLNGAIYAGGVAGVVGGYAALQNSYCAANSVSAYNRIGIVGGSDAMAHAYAGGVAGYLYPDSIITNCFSVANVTAYATAGNTRYAHADKIIGEVASADTGRTESVAGISLNNYAADAGVNFTNADVVKSVLGWSDDDWSFDGAYPAVKQVSGAKKVTLNVDGDGQYVFDKYQPLSLWYASNGLPEFVTDGSGKMSYGYLIKDGEKYYKAPSSYVPVGECALYVSFNDYSEVAGIYYLKDAVAGSGIYIELESNGTLVLVNGAAQYTSYYTYDGDYVLLFDCPLFLTQVASTDSSGNTVYSYVTYVGKALVGNYYIMIYDNQTYSQSSYYLHGVKKIEGLTYGTYYYETYLGIEELTLNSDGTAVYNNSIVTYTYDYGHVLSINGISATFGTDTVQIGSTVYKAYDEYKGVWETAASAQHAVYEFDGKGKWLYTSFVYENAGGTNTVKDISTAYGTYTVSNGTVTLNDDNAVYGTAHFDENGFLKLTANSVETTLYRENSNVGEWKLFYSESVTLNFGGIGKSGVGTVTVTSNYLAQPVEMKYEVVDGEVLIYVGYDLYAQLSFDLQKLTLSGETYSYRNGDVITNAVFCLYDNFKGEWLSSEFGVITFDGLGLYDLTADQATGIAVGGKVTIANTSVPYTVDGTGFVGSFTYKDVTYTITYNATTDTVTVSGGGKNFVMLHYDDWRKVELSDAAGNVYTFNGFGNLAEGGTATITLGETYTTYGYKTSADGNTVTLTSAGGATFCTIVKSAGGFVLKKSGASDISLKIVNVFTGSWTIGKLGGSVTIGEIGSDYTASGTYCGKNVTFAYDAESNTMSFEYDGKTLYLVKLSIVSGKPQEIALCEAPSTRYGFIRLINSSIELDKFAGEYVCGDGRSLILDGFTVSSVGLGKATLTLDNGDTREYDYEENQFGMVVLKNEGVISYILNPLEADEEGSFELSGNYYSLVRPDKFYGLVSFDAGYEDNGLTYRFNGVGQIICSDNTVYSYDVVPEADYENLEYVFSLTDSEGNKYTAVMSFGTTDNPMVISKDN